MTTRDLLLPEEVYEQLQKVAEQDGVSPAEWIAATVSRAGVTVPTDKTVPTVLVARPWPATLALLIARTRLQIPGTELGSVTS